jgi:hypothetical protein
LSIKKKMQIHGRVSRRSMTIGYGSSTSL